MPTSEEKRQEVVSVHRRKEGRSHAGTNTSEGKRREGRDQREQKIDPKALKQRRRYVSGCCPNPLPSSSFVWFHRLFDATGRELYTLLLVYREQEIHCSKHAGISGAARTAVETQTGGLKLEHDKLR